MLKNGKGRITNLYSVIKQKKQFNKHTFYILSLITLRLSVGFRSILLEGLLVQEVVSILIHRVVQTDKTS